MLPCFSKQLFGIDCPGCGLQRSILLLLNGEFIAAFKMYPAIYPLLALACVILLNKIMGLKYATQMIMGLSISSVALILINFFIKLIH
ncbi:DUF2752 domain-containing protein [Croceitalea sp. P059]|uniref:DUF2752 domain-containing protein n=1 Tax=Croceitalea sp. P059 TaxID=3075601 RepID=UPI002884AF32|nr:DUF2752 domain-containing protein [Croceitalea sp. P059]MDT0540782.1 DUF2752 domain-containing protein [Croceitalea sp. P059]